MLPGSMRLQPSLAKRGKKIQTPFFGVYLEPNRTPNNKFMFIVGTEVSKSSVVRHKIKRLLSEVAKEVAPSGLNVTIIAKPGIQKLGLLELRREVAKNIK